MCFSLNETRRYVSEGMEKEEEEEEGDGCGSGG